MLSSACGRFVVLGTLQHQPWGLQRREGHILLFPAPMLCWVVEAAGSQSRSLLGSGHFSACCPVPFLTRAGSQGPAPAASSPSGPFSSGAEAQLQRERHFPEAERRWGLWEQGTRCQEGGAVGGDRDAGEGGGDGRGPRALSPCTRGRLTGIQAGPAQLTAAQGKPAPQATASFMSWLCSLLAISSWISVPDTELSKFSVHCSSANRVAPRGVSV